MSLFVGVLHNLAKVVRVDGVEDVEEVLTMRSFVFRVLVWEIAVHDRIVFELWPQCLRGQLLIMRHFDDVHLVLLQQLLLAGQHILEEVLVDEWLWWQVELQTKYKE